MWGDKEKAWLLFALGLLICALGWNNAFVLDDGSKILNNPDIRSLGSLFSKLIYPYRGHLVLERNDPSRPLVFLVYGLIYAINGGTHPFLFHLVSSLIHGICVAFVFYLLRSLAPERPRWAWGSALLFAVSPIQTGSVLYAYALSDLLAAALMLASIYSFRTQWHPAYMLHSRLLFLLSLGCKQSAIVTPLLIILNETFFPKNTSFRLRQLSGHAWIAAAYLAWRFFYFGSVGDLEGEGHTHTFVNYLSCQGYLFWKYLRMSFLPWGLSVDHYLLPMHISWFQRILGWSGICVLCAVVIRYYRTHSDRWEARLSLWALLWFGICWGPTSSLLPTVDLFVERRVYLANMSLFASAVGLLELAWAHLKWAESLLPWLGCFSLLILALVTIHRSRVWKTPEGIWKESLGLYSVSQRALNNLSTYYIDQGRYLEARSTLETLMSLYPKDPYAYGNLGSLFNKPDAPFHDLKVAEKLFLKALELDSQYFEAYYNLGRLYHMQGQDQRGLELYTKTLELKPNHVGALNNLGVYWMNHGDPVKARAYFNRAVEIDSSYQAAWSNLARMNQTAPSLPLSSLPIGPSGDTPPPAARPVHEVPLDQVPSEVIINTYRMHLKDHPEDAKARKAFKDFCNARRLDCGG